MRVKQYILISMLVTVATVWFAAGNIWGGLFSGLAALIVVWMPKRAFTSEYEELVAENERLRDGRDTTAKWLEEAKLQAGYSTYTSFDVVWADALAALNEKRAREGS